MTLARMNGSSQGPPTRRKQPGLGMRLSSKMFLSSALVIVVPTRPSRASSIPIGRLIGIAAAPAWGWRS